MSTDSENPPEEDGRQGMTDRYQGRHGGAEYEEEQEEEDAPACASA